MIRRPPSRLSGYPIKSQLAQIECIDKHIDHTNCIVLVYPVFEVFWKQRALRTFHSLNETLHARPLNSRESLRQESHEAARFHTARVIHDRGPVKSLPQCPDPDVRD